MPQHLQESSDSSQLLQERIDALEQWISDLQDIDLDSEVELTEDEELEVFEGLELEDLTDEEKEIKKQEALDEALENKKNERIDKIMAELEGVDSGL